MSRPAAIGTAQLAALGWKRVDGGKSKLDSRYAHTAGWTLVHCGHPTANHPYLLRDPQRRVVLNGVLAPPAHRADFGTAWANLRAAAEWLQRHLAGAAPVNGPYRSVI